MKPFVAALFLVTAMASPARAANLVVNGGFETGDFSGWTQFGSPLGTAVGTGNTAHSGTYGAFFGPLTMGGIEQAISTVAGTSYAISFWLQNLAGQAPNEFDVYFDGAPALMSLDNAPLSPFTQYSVIGTANSTQSLLRFEFLHIPAYWHIDDISVQALAGGPGSVPEPATWAMMIAGFGLAGGRLRRRRALAG